MKTTHFRLLYGIALPLILIVLWKLNNFESNLFLIVFSIYVFYNFWHITAYNILYCTGFEYTDLCEPSFHSEMNDNVCKDGRGRFLFNPKDSPGCARAALNYCSKYYFDGKPIQFREEYTNGWDEIGSNPTNGEVQIDEMVTLGDGEVRIDTTVYTLGVKQDGYGTSLHFPKGGFGFNKLCKTFYESTGGL